MVESSLIFTGESFCGDNDEGREVNIEVRENFKREKRERSYRKVRAIREKRAKEVKTKRD